MKIYNTTKKTTLATHVAAAETFISRIVGLLNRSSLQKNEALLMRPCQSIHMFFMRFAIDAIFVDQSNQVVGIVRNLRPFKMSPIYLKASFVIEAPTGTIEESRTEIGDLIEVED